MRRAVSLWPASEALKRSIAFDKAMDCPNRPPLGPGHVYWLLAPEDGSYVCHTCSTGFINLKNGEIGEIGFTANPGGGYPRSAYELKFKMDIKKAGAKNTALAIEKLQILGYWCLEQNKFRTEEYTGAGLRLFIPPGNKIYR